MGTTSFQGRDSARAQPRRSTTRPGHCPSIRTFAMQRWYRYGGWLQLLEPISVFRPVDVGTWWPGRSPWESHPEPLHPDMGEVDAQVDLVWVGPSGGCGPRDVRRSGSDALASDLQGHVGLRDPQRSMTSCSVEAGGSTRATRRNIPAISTNDPSRNPPASTRADFMWGLPADSGGITAEGVAIGGSG